MFQLRDKELAQKIIQNLKKNQIDLRVMHVCGTHQDTLMKHGLDTLFRECSIDIRQGPGCPVCVTTPQEIEEAILLAQNGKIVTSFGDMMRVPGDTYSLNEIKAQGHDVRTVYGIEDAVAIAENNEEEVVFMAVGFETTAPTTAAAIQQKPPSNFSILCCHRLIPPALKAILDMGELHLDGFIDPGHVSTIIGTKPYDFISTEYGMPQVVAGFEPIDLLMGVWMLAQQAKNGEAIVENEYSRAVDEEGNKKALNAIAEVFGPMDVSWRGFPTIPQSGMKLRKKYAIYDARKKYADLLCELNQKEFAEPPGCQCGEVLRGLISSRECPLFGTKCTPQTPVGPCMVSREGSCNIEYQYKK